MTSIYIATKFGSGSKDYGGIKRVVDAQNKYLSDYGIELVDDAESADVLVGHATHFVEPKLHQAFVTHCHGLYWDGYQWPKWAQSVNKQVADCIIKSDAATAPSEWVANTIRRGTGRDVTVIGHGVDLDEWPRSSTHNNYVLWDKTRADPICDPKVVNILAAAMPHVKFVTSLGNTASNVSVVGIQSYADHKPYIQNAMLYLCTARETFGIGTLEALACGVPIVGWNWGGQAEFIDRDVGWLSTVGDYDDLKRGIDYCIDPTNRARLSTNARKLVESRYQWRTVIKQYADLYNEIASRVKEDTPLVSVIIPSHNLGKYLPECLDSVLTQTGVDFEVIIVDDCSTDDSYQVAERYVNNCLRVKLFKTPTNLYLAGALNYGISKARGKYIFPLDPDNSVAPNTLKLLSDALTATRDIDIAYGRVKFINDDGTPFISRITDEAGISSWPPPVFDYSKQMSHKNQIPSSSMYRKSVWSRVGGYTRRYRTGEDADFWCRATTWGAKPSQVTRAITLVYRNRADSMSHVNQERPWELWYTNVHSFVKDLDNKASIQVEIPEPVVSVIIPVGPGHGGQLLKDALDSLVNQTFNAWECIVVDDSGSGIEWLPPWVRLFSTGGDGSRGVSVARNIGIKQARGECFVLLDADDFLDATYLEKMYSAFRLHGGYVYCDFFKDTEGRTIQDHKPVDMLHNLVHPITCMFPIQVHNYVRFDETLGSSGGEDWDYILSVLAAGWCGTHVKEPLLYYRQNSGHNRELLKQNVVELRQQLGKRWGEQVAGCGCSRGGGGCVGPNCNGGSISTSASASLTANTRAPINNSEMVLVEFVRPNSAAINYRGPATGTDYRFGSDEGHKIKYVYRSDVDFFLNRSEFKLADVAAVS